MCLVYYSAREISERTCLQMLNTKPLDGIIITIERRYFLQYLLRQLIVLKFIGNIGDEADELNE